MAKESYPPMNQWRNAENRFQNYPLKNNEFTLIVNKKNGQAYHVVARQKNKILQTTYLDGCSFPSGMKQVTVQELENRKASH